MKHSNQKKASKLYLLFLLLIIIFCPNCPRIDILSMLLYDGIPPAILTMTPGDGETLISLSPTIFISFSESMERASVEEAFSISPGEIDLEFQWVEGKDSQELNIQLNTLLREATNYTITMAQAATDINLIQLDTDYTNTFTTLTNPRVAAGMNYTIVLKQDGTVWSWGDNDSSQLGNDSTVESILPVSVSGLDHILNLEASTRSQHSLAVKSDGVLYGWGYNYYSQLGLGSSLAEINQGIPQVIDNPAGDLGEITGLACGFRHSLALDSAGNVWGWGYTNHGQIGLENGVYSATNHIYVPTQLPGLSQITSIACGDYFSAAIASDGNLWMWGYNYCGQLGFATTQTTNDKTDVPTKVAGLDNIIAVAGGNSHAIAIREVGGVRTIWTWGYNLEGQLGRTTGLDYDYVPTVAEDTGIITGSIIKVSAGSEHTLILTDEGNVYGCGNNTDKQVGAGAGGLTIIKIPIYDVVDIAAGGYHSVALKSDGTVWTWGNNLDKQLGRDNDGAAVIDKVPGFNLNG